jgi:lysophospholipase L1-like esterase
MRDAIERPETGGGLIRTPATLAFVLPAWVAFARLAEARRAEADFASAEMAQAIAAVLWTAAALGVPPLRRFLGDLGEWLVARLAWPIFAAAALFAAACVTTIAKSPASSALAVASGLLALAGARRAFARDRRRCGGLALLLALNLLLLGLADLGVRLLLLPRVAHNDIFVVHDPWLGWKLRPEWTIDRRIPLHDYVSHETSNRLGFRGPVYPTERPAGTRRIVVLGDSHTEGYTVSDGETWPEQMERALDESAAAARSSSDPVQVMAFGVGGYATDQEYLAWLEYARPYRPDLVLLQFCSNDPPDNVSANLWRGRKPHFVRFGEQLVLEGVPVPDDRLSFTHDTLLAHSAIALLMQISLGKLAVAHELSTTYDEREAWEVTRLLLRALARSVAADGARLALFHSGSDEREVDARIRALCKDESIEFLDVDPAFGGDYKSFRVKDDTHWNARGHAAVGRMLAKLVAPLLDGR